MEVIIVDGSSTDRTVAVAHEVGEELGLAVEVLDNPARRTSSSLNRGLAAARGRIVVRLDARSRVQPEYVGTCVEALDGSPPVGVVGGAQVARPERETLVARGIGRALRNRWFTGLSRYRRATISGPSDTVWMGTFRSDELRSLGGWDPRIALNEDFDLNRRYRDAGWVVWFEASLRSVYVPRATLRAFALQYFRFGRVKGTWWARGQPPNARQLLLLVAPIVGTATLWRLGRRFGTVPVSVIVGAALVGLDQLGQEDRPNSPDERVAAMVAACTSSGAWLAGVAAGMAGERLGIEHQHG
jgi:cellulose synthase/poly-beta-1,6-N-acetylglucosamine synthase-like glycosyltransferase